MEIVRTKLMVPTLPEGLIERATVIEELLVRSTMRLILVSAPAGAGKTTLLSQWARRQAQRIAWVSLDASENHLHQFLLYLSVSLEQAGVLPNDMLSAELRSQGVNEPQSFVGRILNALTERAVPVTLVLDDYHVITSAVIHDILGFFLHHLPPFVRLALGTRADPPLALGHLRARGQLCEVRNSALRFSVPEVDELLNRLHGLALPEAAIEQLARRTEGWVAGLQLASLSLVGRADKESFISAFAGSNRHLADYLLSEVFARQPLEVQRFLLRTAVLDRLCANLCDAVTQQSGSGEILRKLEAENLFVLPLGDARKWYRYHHLFAEFLRERLEEHEPKVLYDLCRRASYWFSAEGLVGEATDYALLADEPRQAAESIESVAFSLGVTWDNAQFIRLVQKLPVALLPHFPRLCIFYAWALTNTGQLGALAELLPILEASEAYAGEPHTVRACVLTMKAYERLRDLDFAGSADLCRAALAELGPPAPSLSNEARWLFVASSNLLVYGFLESDPPATETLYPAAIRHSERYGNLVGRINGYARLGRVQHQVGHLRAAQHTLEQGLAIVQELARPGTSGGQVVNAAELQVNLACLLFEQNRLDDATLHLAQAHRLSKLSGFPPVLLQGYKLAFRLARAHGSVAEAWAQLTELEDASRAIHPANVLHRNLFEIGVNDLKLTLVGDLKAKFKDEDTERLLGEVVAWSRRYQLNADDRFNYPLEGRYVILARLRMLQNRRAEASGLLERLIALAEGDGRTTDLITYLLLHALAQPERPAGLDSLERALHLAEPEGYRRIFLEQGEKLRALMINLTRVKPSRYLTTLLSSFNAKEQGERDHELTERQRDILRHMTAGCSNKEIAKRLGLSLNTVKWYVREIYGVLGVNTRVKAVNLARAQGLGFNPPLGG